MGPPEDPKIRALFSQDGLAVMNLADAEGLARNLSFLHALVVPRSTVDLARQKPDADLSIVASTITLVARDDVHPALVYLLMSIVDDVQEPPSLLHRENEFPSDKDTDLPLSPQAESYYRSGKPFLQRYLPFGLASAVERLLKVAAPLLLVIFPILRGLPAFYQWRVKSRLARVYRQLLDVERPCMPPALLARPRSTTRGSHHRAAPARRGDSAHVLERAVRAARAHRFRTTADRARALRPGKARRRGRTSRDGGRRPVVTATSQRGTTVVEAPHGTFTCCAVPALPIQTSRGPHRTSAGWAPSPTT